MAGCLGTIEVEQACGNGLVEPKEECDSTNLNGFDCQGLGYASGTLLCGQNCRFDRSLCVPDALCGNQNIDPGEQCDGLNLGGVGCQDYGYTGGFLSCTTGCQFDLSGCENAPACGDGLVEGTEECDGQNLNQKTCLDFGFTGGDLTCTSLCSFDTSGCTAAPDCGNGVLDAGEQCDGSQLNGMTCLDFGYPGGMLSCTGGCMFSFDSCQAAPSCGDGNIDSGEECDGVNLGGQSCQSLGFDSGTLFCSPTCSLDTSGCQQAAWCGNGVVDDGEQCDGSNLNGESCQSQGFDAGTIACTAYCAFDLSGCSNHPPCGNGVLDSGEVCDGDQVSCQSLDPIFVSGTATCLADCSGYDQSQCLENQENIELDGMAADIQMAAQITGAGHMAVMQMEVIGLKEWELKDVISQAFDDNGSDSSYAFDHIVASGPNALSLHYSGGSRTIQDGDLVLMDLGARYNGYCGDISRTIPANGTFTPRQRELYQLVLDTQAATAEYMQPGVHSLSDANAFANDFFRASPLRAENSWGQETTMDNFFIHSVGHYIGQDVHGSDLGLSTYSPVQVGQVFTLEPGLYIDSEGIGIRIEDDYVMTENGAVNIYLQTPKTVEEVEAFMQGKSPNPSLIERASKRPADPAGRLGGYTDHMDF